jgi:hypothetical protein
MKRKGCACILRGYEERIWEDAALSSEPATELEPGEAHAAAETESAAEAVAEEAQSKSSLAWRAELQGASQSVLARGFWVSQSLLALQKTWRPSMFAIP